MSSSWSPPGDGSISEVTYSAFLSTRFRFVCLFDISQLSRWGRLGRLRSIRSALSRAAFSSRLAMSPVSIARNTVAVFLRIGHRKLFATLLAEVTLTGGITAFLCCWVYGWRCCQTLVVLAAILHPTGAPDQAKCVNRTRKKCRRAFKEGRVQSAQR